MKFEITNKVISSYKRFSYEAWYAFAEFVDNSTQSYFDHKKELDEIFNASGERLSIYIEYDPKKDLIRIRDNSYGMDAADLDKALKVGNPPEDPSGRSRYGLGMKTAACWFGNKWKIKTSKLGDNKAYEVAIDVNFIANQEGDIEIIPQIYDVDKDSHFTVIEITSLNRKFVGRTLGKIKEHLSSMYRFDIAEGTEIYWNGSKLIWYGYEDELYVNKNGIKYKKDFTFEINGKLVKGWVGVLGKGYGSRKKAGFSIIQNRRVIQGPPNAFKPNSIFGEQEDGSNDLVNQRVIGELFLESFSVSHTKDKIVWESAEEEELDNKLGDFCADAKELALTLRFNKENRNGEGNNFKEQAVYYLQSELKSNELGNYLNSVQPYPETVIEKSFKKTSEKAKDENDPALRVNIGSNLDMIYVSVYFNENSEFEPYVLSETALDENNVIVVINLLHPHIYEMQNAESLINFVRHSIYDGVAEWKALKLRGSLQPFTIKFLKDGLLRIPFEIKRNKAV